MVYLCNILIFKGYLIKMVRVNVIKPVYGFLVDEIRARDEAFGLQIIDFICAAIIGIVSSKEPAPIVIIY